jgi:transitional endoplasmic reticulum ATPase
MLTLLLIFFVFMMFVSAAGSASRRRRRRALEEAERQRQWEAQQAGGGGAPASPFGASPLGSIFEAMLRGPMIGSQSLEYDPETGEWVDVSQRRQPAPPEPADPAAPAPREPSAAQRRRERARRAQRPESPLSGLLGGMMPKDGSGTFDVQPPEELTTFTDVGGMDTLKQEVRDTVGLMLEHPEDADRFGIEWNGMLLHGPPGVGKTFIAAAIAGEYRMNFIHVSTGDLVSGIQGGSAQNVEKAFNTALDHLPCLLFFDEFDSVAQRRDSNPDQEARRTVNQLLTSLEANRDERRLLVMAATNSIDHLDPAIIRPGRFDRHVRIDLPDAGARRGILEAELDDRPVVENIDLDELVRRTEGMTPATIEKVVDAAALAVFREAAQTGEQLQVDTPHLLAAIEELGGDDRPTVEHWNWDSLVLDADIKTQLQQLQAIIEDPESARKYGIDPPTGLLLAGPPGTGKTTVAKVLAAQAHCSFYPVSGADVMSKWVGESEGNIRRLFERARANRPSIVFIDEIDAIAGRRGTVEVHDTHVNQLLAEIDGVSGQRGVFVIGATNRPDQIDPAMLRGGRLSRTIVLGLPDEAARAALLALHTARMPTVEVRLDELARETEGLSPADLKALCQEAGLVAMTRGEPAGAAVTHADFTEALKRHRASAEARYSAV